MHASPGHATTPRRVLSRRRLLAASAGAFAGSAALIGTLRAQSGSSAGHSPFSQAVATPEAAVAGPENLVALLSFVPRAMLDRPEGSGVHWYYADLAQQLDTLGVPRNEDGPDENEALLPALLPLMTASNAFQYARIPEFTDAIGFDPLAIHQTLLAGDPPGQLTLFRGGLVPDTLAAAWKRAGYTAMATADGTAFWSIGIDGDIDLEHPIQRAVMATFNNVTLVDDTLICAPTQALLEAALGAGAGEKPSAAADSVFGAALRTLPATTVSAMALSPSGVGVLDATDPAAGPVDDLIAESDAAVGPMPPYDGLLTAVAAGAVSTEDGGGAGTAMIRIVTGSAADAEQVTNVVEYRWNEGASLLVGAPYSDLMTITGTSVDDTVAMIDFEQLENARMWSGLFFSRDTLPFLQ